MAENEEYDEGERLSRARDDYPYPDDEFDRAAENLANAGAHRAADSLAQRSLVPLLAALAALLVLVFLVMFWGGHNNLGSRGTDEGSSPAASSSSQSSDSSSEESSSAAPDMSIPVRVVNGTGESGLAGDVSDVLSDQGFTVAGTANGFTDQIEATTVYYKSEDSAATAQAVADALGAGDVQQSDNYDDEITVVAMSRPSE